MAKKNIYLITIKYAEPMGFGVGGFLFCKEAFVYIRAGSEKAAERKLHAWYRIAPADTITTELISENDLGKYQIVRE